MKRPSIVVLGAMTRYPVSGIVWLTMQYVLGFQKLGYDCYYVECHGGTPRPFVENSDDGTRGATRFLADLMTRFDLSDRWAFHAGCGSCYGISESQLHRLYGSATLIVNLHGATIPRPEHAATGRLVYIGTDPVLMEVQLHQGSREAIALLEPHAAFFTWAGNHGRPDCKLPVSDRFAFTTTRQPLVLDLWDPSTSLRASPSTSLRASPSTSLGVSPSASRRFTTIGGWRQLWRELELDGEVYHWSKHYEFLKFLGLPERSGETFELALTSYDASDREMLETHGWTVRDAAPLSADLDLYRGYIGQSHGEFTVAKDQNVRLRTGWFSDRSAAYLAAGRPVVTQETGFNASLPTGDGLFGFSTLDEAATAVEAITSDYEHHSASAKAIAAEYFDHRVVLPPLLSACGA